MNQLAIFLTLLAVLLAATVQQESLNEDFDEIYRRIPVQEILEFGRYYYIYDKDVVEIFDFIFTGGLYEAYEFIMEQKEVKEFKLWIGAHLFVDNLEAITVYRKFLYTVEAMSKYLELGGELSEDRKPGWDGLMEAFLKILPSEEIGYLIRQKIAEGKLFSEFFHRLQALKPVYERVIKDPKVVKPLDHLKSLGVDIQQFDRYIREILGW